MSNVAAYAIRVLRHALEFVRPKIIITCCIIGLIGLYSSGRPTIDLLFVPLILLTWYVHAASANDYADRHIDAINIPGARHRPLLSNHLSIPELWIIHGFAGIFCLALASYFGAAGVALVGAILLLDYAYSFQPIYLSGRGIVSQLTLPLAYVCLPFTLGSWSSTQADSYSWILMIGIYFGFVARLFLKDFRDTKGDAMYDKRTFLLRHGVVRTCVASGIFALISFVCIAVFLNNATGIIFGLLLLHAIALILLVELMDVTEDQKLTIIGVLAIIGNISAVIILFYVILAEYFPTNSLLVNLLPVLVGIALLIRTSRRAGLWITFDSPSFFQHLVWIPVRIFMHLCCSVQVKGVEHIKNTSGNVIIASNHVSELDPLLIVASMPFFSRQLPTIYVVREKSYYNQHWKGIRKALYGGSFFEVIGGYEAYRGLQDYEKSLTHHLRALQEGRSVTIFPVGRWHKDTEHDQARGGVAFLAANTNKPIIPVRIQGIDSKMTSKDYLRRKAHLTVTFGEPLHAEDLFDKPLNEIADDDRVAFENAAQKLMKIVSTLK